MPELGTEVTFLFEFLAFLGIIWELHFQHAFHCINHDLLITKFVANVLDFQSLNFIFSYLTEKKQSKKNTILWPLSIDGVQQSQGNRATSKRQFTFCYSVSRIFWYSFNWPRKIERLSQPWSHQVVLNLGPLNWQSSALTTRSLIPNLTKFLDPCLDSECEFP